MNAIANVAANVPDIKVDKAAQSKYKKRAKLSFGQFMTRKKIASS
jgi:hypothetical protein